MYFIDADYDKLTKESWAKILHNGKIYMGFANLHPDDEEYESRFAGCLYAETRAMIAALKEEHKQKKAECEAIRKFVKSLNCYKKWDNSDDNAKVVYRQLNQRIKEVNRIAEKINNLEFSLMVSNSTRDKIHNRQK